MGILTVFMNGQCSQRWYRLHLENTYIRSGLGASEGVVVNARSPMHGEILWQRLIADCGFDLSWIPLLKNHLSTFHATGAVMTADLYQLRSMYFKNDTEDGYMRLFDTDGRRKGISSPPFHKPLTRPPSPNSPPCPHRRYAFRYARTDYTGYAAAGYGYTGPA